jgi:CheY-like chemotaxis protein
MKTARGAPSAKLIVVIDDDPAILDGMSGLLRGWGYRVVAAASGDAALAGLAELGQQPDFIICDYQLPDGKYGTQAIAQLRHAYEIPAVLITGATVPASAPGDRSPPRDVLHKPVDVSVLQSMLSRALKR